MIEGIQATYAESTKDFATPNDLAKAYTELNARASTATSAWCGEEARKDPALSTFKNVNDLAKSFIETKKLVGTIKHAPAKPEEYKFTALKDLHAGLSSEGTQKFLATRLHALDIDNDRADKLQQEILIGLHNGMVQRIKSVQIRPKKLRPPFVMNGQTSMIRTRRTLKMSLSDLVLMILGRKFPATL